MGEVISLDANEVAKGATVQYAQPVVSEDYLAGAKFAADGGGTREPKNPWLRYPEVDKNGAIVKAASPMQHDDWNAGFHDVQYKIHAHNEALKNAAAKDAEANAFDPMHGLKTDAMIAQEVAANNNKSDSLEGDPKLPPIKKSEK